MRVCVGRIVGVHGIRGHVKVKSFTHVPEDLFSYTPLFGEESPISLRPLSFQGAFFVASCQGVTTRTAAEHLRGMSLYVDRDQFPLLDEEEVYVIDLVGLPVTSEENITIGVISAVENHGGGDFLVIQLDSPEGTEEKTEATLPFSKEAVPQIDLAQGLVRICRDFLILSKQGKTQKEFLQ